VKIKTDENISADGVALLRSDGHDVTTVSERGLAGSDDDRLFRICVAERRTLVTLDRDFGHILRLTSAVSRHRDFGSWRAGVATAAS
jgi:predicted nuclease of predicted toxin-antitoxin system